MRLRTRLAVLVCKASGAVLRKLGRGGTNLPGRLALKIDKNILGELSRGVKVTVVTGTNGKTTTSRMIEQAFADAGLRYFSNKSGANLLTGIIAVFAQHATLSGKCPYTHALIECDEAAFRRTSEYLPRRVPCRQQHLPRPARPLRRDHAYAERHPRGHHPCPERDAVSERGLLADRLARRGRHPEPCHPLRRQRPHLFGDRARAVRCGLLHPLQDAVRI